MQKMAQEGITGFSGVPSTFALLLNRVKLSDYDLSRVCYMTQAGGAMSPAHIKRLTEELPHVNLFVMYGQTEATARIAYLPPEQLKAKVGAVGIAIPGVTMELRDEHGMPVAPGKTGEIWVRGENIMLGYWNSPEATASALHDGWLKTGDLAQQDSDGYFFIQGRRSDMIKAGAHRISPQEIEEAILELDGVAEVAVVGVPDEIMGETIKAVVVPRAGYELEPRAVQAHCHGRLASYKVPKRVEFVAELPKTSSGKIKRFQLIGNNTQA
jgi:acyl-CoA synthetase (AMP-forming)/AMP-acid ligase II